MMRLAHSILPMIERLRRPNLLASATTVTSFRNPDHHGVELRFQDVRRGVAGVRMQAVDRQEQVIGVKILQHALGLRTDKRARRAPQNPADHDQRNSFRFRQLVGHIQRIRDHRQRQDARVPNVPRNLRGRRSRIQNDGLMRAKELCGSLSDTHFFGVMEALFETQR
jgi:hypothetical protein